MMRILLCILFLFPLTAQADELVRSITVHGQAEAEVKPDTALIGITIENKAPTLDDTKRMQDKETTKLMRVVRDAKIDEQDVKTQYARLQPYHEYNRTTKKNEFRGYMASTTVQIKVRDLDKVGRLTDALIKADFDRMNNVQYVLDDDRPHRDTLLVNALKNARDKASKLAKAENFRLGAAITIQEGYKTQPAHHQPMLMARGVAEMSMDSAGAVAPPQGMIQLSGTVTATYELTEQ